MVLAALERGHTADVCIVCGAKLQEWGSKHHFGFV